MAKLDRKKFRQELQKNKEAHQDDVEDFQGSKAELLAIKTSKFISRHRVRFLIGMLSIVLVFTGIIGAGEYSKYRLEQATIEIEGIEKKHSSTPGLTPDDRIKDFEVLKNKYSSSQVSSRILKKLADLYVIKKDYANAAALIELIPQNTKEPKELLAYFYYIAGSYREQANDLKKAGENYSLATSLIGLNKETSTFTAWTYYQSGRLKYLNGDKEGAIKDLKKVLEIESQSESPSIAEVRELATYLIIKINKG